MAESTNYSDDEWDEYCGKIRDDISSMGNNYYNMILNAISNKYKIEINVHNFNIHQNGSYKTLKIDNIGNYNETIYLRKSNNHFDLMKLVK